MKPFFFLLSGLFLLCGCKGDRGVQTFNILDEGPVFRVTLQATVKNDDRFSVYYTTDGSTNFSKNAPIWTKVNGSANSQRITFSLPENLIPSQLRIDLGHNAQQGPIHLEKVRLSYKTKAIEFPGTLIFSYFRPDVKKTKIDATNGWVTGIVTDGKRQAPSLYPKEAPLRDEIDRLTQ